MEKPLFGWRGSPGGWAPGPRRVRTSIDPGTVGLVCLVLPAVVLIMHASLARPLKFPALAPQHMSGPRACIWPVPIISRSRFSPRFHGHGIYCGVCCTFVSSSMGEPSRLPEPRHTSRTHPAPGCEWRAAGYRATLVASTGSMVGRRRWLGVHGRALTGPTRGEAASSAASFFNANNG